MSARALRRHLIAGAAGAALLLALPAAAGAHVNAAGSNAAGVTTVSLTFSHGCGTDAPTTALRVLLPDGATEIAPEDPAGWTSTVTGGELTWSGGSVPYHDTMTFVVSMRLVDPEGTTVFLPTVQECPGGAEEPWIVKSEDPGDDEAAPRITAGPVVPADEPVAGGEVDGGRGSTPSTEPEMATNDGGAPAPATSAPAASDQAAPATEDASSTSSSSVPLILGIVAAIIVIGVVLWFVLARRGSSPTPPSTTPPSPTPPSPTPPSPTPPSS